MDWLVVNPHFHGTFASLGTQVGDIYKVNEDCLATLCDILGKLTIEDRTLRTYRRAIGFAQVVKKDLLPLLIGVRNDPKITDVTIEILLNLTVPVETLLPMEVMMKTDAGRYTVMELSMLLSTSKEAFIPPQSTRPVVNHIKTILEKEPKLAVEDCERIHNCLLLLRNILHIPEHHSSGSNISMQNQILWNLFAQNIDKVLIQLMTSEYRILWGVTIVQLIALMFKDQQVGTLQKLLNLWFESSLSDSSEGNESNTSPQHQASVYSSSMMTSDPTSDSSDNGGSNKKCSSYQAGEVTSINNESDDSQSSEPSSSPSTSAPHQALGGSSVCAHQTQLQTSARHSSKLRVKSLCELQARPSRFDKHESDMDTSETQLSSGPAHSCTRSRNRHNVGLPQSAGQNHQRCHASSKEMHSKGLDPHVKPYGTHALIVHTKSLGKKLDTGEVSDCGYGTQQENQESNSTSSNEDDVPHRCVKHQKPQHMLQKSRYSGKLTVTPQERKELHRKKLVKRSRMNIMHMKALLHHSPSDDDISNLLKEFTVDFLLRGYGHLVEVLLHHLLSGTPVHMDTSHFFWLVTYFLKFATQLELDLNHISSVLTIDVLSYLTYEGVNLHEELQGLKGSHRDLKPCLRRMHLVITSIREFIQAVEAYQKISHLTEDDRNHLLKLQLQVANIQDLRSLFVLLLRQFDPSIQSHQFLQDLVVTNHNLLTFLDNTLKLPQYVPNVDIMEHLKQFGTLKVMFNYGLLLEHFLKNGEFVNDCILTMMHHVAGDLSQVHILFQPSILRCFSRIGEAEYEICDDWSDLIQYVVHKFMKTPVKSPVSNQDSTSHITSDGQDVLLSSHKNRKTEWTKEDCDNLYWYYEQNCNTSDVIGEIVNMFKKSGVLGKTRIGVIQQLLLLEVINDQQYQSFMEAEASLVMVKEFSPSACMDKKSYSASTREERCGTLMVVQEEMEQADDISILKGKLMREGNRNVIQWLQELLIELCYVKIRLVHDLTAIMEPIPMIYTRLQQSTPLVPWYAEQELCLLNPTFILLLHKLGLHLAGDADKVFPRIPHFWTPDILINTAKKLESVKTGKLKFSLDLLKKGSSERESFSQKSNLSEDESPLKQMGMSSTTRISHFGENVFRIPTVTPRSSLSLSKFTPKPVVSSIPNWLQVVAKSKATNSTTMTSIEKGPLCNTNTTSQILPLQRESSASYTFPENINNGSDPSSRPFHSVSSKLHPLNQQQKNEFIMQSSAMDVTE